MKMSFIICRRQAERQAVNTTVQGSGADLVKTAMINIDRELARRYPDTVTTHKHCFDLNRQSEDGIASLLISVVKYLFLNTFPVAMTVH